MVGSKEENLVITTTSKDWDTIHTSLLNKKKHSINCFKKNNKNPQVIFKSMLPKILLEILF